MNRELRRQERELADPAHPRQEVDPLVELSAVDDAHDAAVRDERHAVKTCDRMCACLDPIGTSVGSAGPPPVEVDFGLLGADATDTPVFGSALGDEEPDPWDVDLDLEL